MLYRASSHCSSFNPLCMIFRSNCAVRIQLSLKAQTLCDHIKSTIHTLQVLCIVAIALGRLRLLLFSAVSSILTGACFPPMESWVTYYGITILQSVKSDRSCIEKYGTMDDRLVIVSSSRETCPLTTCSVLIIKQPFYTNPILPSP